MVYLNTLKVKAMRIWGRTNIYYMSYVAELVCAEKKHSDWLPDRSEFSAGLERAECFNFDKKNQNVLNSAHECRNFTRRATKTLLN